MIYQDKNQNNKTTNTKAPMIVETFMFRDEGRRLAAELEKLGVHAEIMEKAPCG